MLFNSLSYAVFLPVVFVIYWIIPHRFRWLILLVASYYFYMSWNPKYVVLILATTGISYTAALVIEKRKRISSKAALLGSTVFCVGVLFFFKYFNFFVSTVTAVAGVFSFKLHPLTLNLLLPVGISFYTFQTMSYVIDVYKGRAEAEHHFGIYATFISFFPQLVAGPIERTNNLLPQIKSEKNFDYALAMAGARQILWGFYKKIAIADVVSFYVDSAYSDITRCTPFDLCFAILFFSIQIYCDFSGYSDIAIGTAKLFGIQLMVNFKSPYFSLSVREFWSRWHISLSTWFRDYVYIPLGGNRCSKLKTNINVMITFLVSGLWHGANWTFVFWGGMHGLAQILENIFTNRYRVKSTRGKVISWIFVFLFCNVAWVFFRADTIGDAWYVIRNAFGSLSNFDGYLHTNIGLSYDRLLFCTITILLLALYDYVSLKFDVIYEAACRNRLLVVSIEYMVVIIIIWALIMGAGSNQFVYFQF